MQHAAKQRDSQFGANDRIGANESGIDRQFSEVSAAVVEHLPHMRAFARSLAASRDQADDLVGEAAARALAAAHQFRPGTNFKAWIFTILRNAFYTEGRKRWSRVISLDDDDVFHQPSVAASQEDSLSFCDFRRAFWHLSPKQREVLMLVGNSDLSYEEVAEICECPVGTVKSRVSRARLDLKRILEGETMPMQRASTPAMAGTDLIDSLENFHGPQEAIGVGRRRRGREAVRRPAFAESMIN
jgi:RNA polymerase sigma-70 factor (ECF subfamily)